MVTKIWSNMDSLTRASNAIDAAMSIVLDAPLFVIMPIGDTWAKLSNRSQIWLSTAVAFEILIACSRLARQLWLKHLKKVSSPKAVNEAHLAGIVATQTIVNLCHWQISRSKPMRCGALLAVRRLSASYGKLLTTRQVSYWLMCYRFTKTARS